MVHIRRPSATSLMTIGESLQRAGNRKSKNKLRAARGPDGRRKQQLLDGLFVVLTLAISERKRVCMQMQRAAVSTESSSSRGSDRPRHDGILFSK